MTNSQKPFTPSSWLLLFQVEAAMARFDKQRASHLKKAEEPTAPEPQE
jgi:hypothetical protein